jgi:hypothetical protein
MKQSIRVQPFSWNGPTPAGRCGSDHGREMFRRSRIIDQGSDFAPHPFVRNCGQSNDTLLAH